MSSNREPLRPLAAFPYVVQENIRFGDTDWMGHVNNAVYSTYFESGRTTMLHQARAAGEAASFVLAHIAIDFRGEMHWPGTVDIGTGIQSIGTSSFTVAQAVFKDGVCCATAKAIVVCIDQTTRRPRPLPEAARQAYQSLMVAAEPA